MIEYAVMFGVPLLVALILSLKSGKLVISRKKQSPIPIIVFFVLFYLLLALRSEDVGIDLKRYIYLFRTSDVLPINTYVKERASEIAFFLLIRFIHAFAGVRTFIFVISFFIVLPTAILYFTESEKPMLSIAFYMLLPVFGMAFSGLRQAIAVSIVGLSYYFIKNRKPLLFLLIIGIAFFFHNTALLGLVLYPVYRIKYRKWMFAVIIPAIVLVFIFNNSIFTFLAGFLGDRYEHSVSLKTSGATGTMLLFSIILACSIFFVDEQYIDEETAGLRNIAVLAVFIQCLAMANPVAMRINYYNILFLPLLVPKIINRTHDKFLIAANVAGWVMTAYFVYYFFNRMISGLNSFQIYPYKFFFNP